MKEIKLTIPEGCKTVTVKVDGEQVITEFEPKEGKFEPKDGDILYGSSITETIIIYKGTNRQGAVLSYAGLVLFLGETLSICKDSYTGFGYTRDYTRYATEEEKKRLFDALYQRRQAMERREEGVREASRWRALYGENYYVIGSELNVDCTDEVGHVVDYNRNKVGNYFRTREAAEKVAEQIREIFKNSKAE